MFNFRRPAFIGLVSLFIAGTAHANTVQSKVHGDKGEVLGYVYFIDTPWGLLIQPNLSKMPKNSAHGFHIHEVGNCDPHGMAPNHPNPPPPGAFMGAGGHFDPHHTGKHLGPHGKGHMGDLPVLNTNNSGEANVWLLAPRLKTRDIRGLALMIHGGGDNYEDQPMPLGGGGPRVGCGIIKDYKPK